MVNNTDKYIALLIEIEGGRGSEMVCNHSLRNRLNHLLPLVHAAQLSKFMI